MSAKPETDGQRLYPMGNSMPFESNEHSTPEPPPPTPEECLPEQPSTSQLPDSDTLYSFLKDMLNEGKLPALISVEGSGPIFKIMKDAEDDSQSPAKFYEEVPMAVPMAVTIDEIKGIVAQEISLLQLVVQRQLREMGRKFSDMVTNTSQIMILNRDLKDLQNNSNLLMRNQEKLLLHTINQIHKMVESIGEEISKQPGRMEAVEERILQSQLTEDTIFACVLHLEERFEKMEAGGKRRNAATQVGQLDPHETRSEVEEGICSCENGQERMLQEPKEYRNGVDDSSKGKDVDACAELCRNDIAEGLAKVETWDDETGDNVKVPVITVRGPDGVEYNLATSMVGFNLDPIREAM